MVRFTTAVLPVEQRSHGRAQHLARIIQRSPSLADDERVRMLAGLTSIAVAVREMVTLIDGMRHDAGNGGDTSA